MVIAYRMDNEIDLLILPPHVSHVLRPLNVSVFAPLKSALASETDASSQLDPGRIQRVGRNVRPSKRARVYNAEHKERV